MKAKISKKQIASLIEFVHKTDGELSPKLDQLEAAREVLRRLPVGHLQGNSVDAVVFQKQKKTVDVKSLTIALKLSAKTIKRFTIPTRHKAVRIVPKKQFTKQVAK